MASDPRDPGAGGVFGDLPPSYTRSPPPVNSDLLRRPSYCHAAFALKQISKVTNASGIYTYTTMLFLLMCDLQFQGFVNDFLLPSFNAMVTIHRVA